MSPAYQTSLCEKFLRTLPVNNDEINGIKKIKMETLLSSVMQHLRSIMIACLTFMSKRCLSSHHKRLSVYNSAAMYIKKISNIFPVIGNIYM